MADERAPRGLGAWVGDVFAAPVLVLSSLTLLDELDRSAFAVLVPTIRDSFGTSIQAALNLSMLTGVVFLGLAVPLAHLADRVHRTRIAAAGAALWAVFVLVTGAAANLAMLVLGRLGAGIGRATILATHDPLISDLHPIDHRPGAYTVHRAGNSIAQFVAPLTIGVVAFYFTWRTPFVAIGVVALLLALIAAFRLPEPIRGIHERRAGGVSDEALDVEEAPASFDEAWRMLSQIKTVRRMWFAVPFLGVAVVGLAPLLQFFYEDVFDLNLSQRATITGIIEPAQLVGFLVVIPLATRLMRRDPTTLLQVMALLGVASSVLIFVLALAPTLAIAVVISALLAAVRSSIAPLLAAAFSLVLPPRVRSVGFVLSGLLLFPSQLASPIIGSVADGWGIRAALLLLVVPLGVGAYLIWSAAAGMTTDIARVRSAATAGAEVRAARMRGESKLLMIRDLDVSYSGIQVLFGVDFEIDEGEIVALLGTNGAGKSTLLKAISGLVDVDGGAIIFDGRDMTYPPANEVVERGVLQVPGGRGIFGSLTVAENMRTAAWLYRHDPDHVRWAVREVLQRFPRLRERWLQPAATLSGGEQQMLTLGMAFIAKPRLLMIDELSLGLAPTVVEELLEMVQLIRESGTTIIVVEQSVNMALTIAEKAFFMEKGEIRFEGPTAELLERPDILRSVFLEGAGSLDVSSAVPAPAATRKSVTAVSPNGDGAMPDEHPEGASVIEVTDLTKVYGVFAAVDEVSLTLRQHQILGIIGPNGAGKTTLFDLISGHVAPTHGRIRFGGADVTGLPADARARLGIGRSFQDAWLFPSLTVAETITMACERRRNVEVLDPIAAALHLPGVKRWERRVADRTDELVELMGLTAYRDKFVSELSTGSRRMVDLACMVAQQPDVILFDEPSSGIAQRETEALGPVLLRIREQTGAALLVIEHDMALITSISDEMLALDRGQVVTQGPPSEVIADEQVVASYLGTSREVIARSGASRDQT